MARIREMLSAQAHHGLDEIEDPDVMAQQVLRDLTDDLQSAQRARVVAMGAKKRLEQERAQLMEDADAWEARAEALLRAGDETVARQALQRAVASRAQAQSLERPLTSADQSVQRVRLQVEQLKRELVEAQARATQIRASQHAADAAGAALQFRDHYSRAMERAQKMDRLARRAGGLEAEAAAAAELVEEAQSLERDADRVTSAAEVEAAMAALRARVNAASPSS